MNDIDPSLRVLIFEAYAGPSHRRVNELLQRYSRHDVEVLEAGRDHWKQLALLSHFEFAEGINREPRRQRPDVLIFSGATNVPGLLTLLPESYRDLPKISYFHESQWSYPSEEADIRPYLVQHLDAVAASSETWFNSAFHAADFWTSATSADMDSRIRAVASQVQHDAESRSRVMFPPVTLDSVGSIAGARCTRDRVVWNARWEHDKRPERLIEALRHVVEASHRPDVLILGTAGKDTHEITAQLQHLPLNVQAPGHLHDRAEYEALLAGGGVVVSTADHEFFGVGVLEAALAGCVPVLPNALAYPETLPSAWFYQSGDVLALARVLLRALEAGDPLHEMHAADAGRFLPEHTVKAWNDGIERVWDNARLDR